LNRVIMHVDMDAFYAAVEQLDRPELRGRPVIVGGTSRRGVVSTASYEARKHGVRSAMPLFEAERRCPHGVFLPVRMGRYKEMSRRVMGVLREVSPLVEPVSIDEAYVDLTGLERLSGPPGEVGSGIKSRILERTRLTCSVGIGPNRFLAKISSDMDKPDGLTVIAPGDVARVIRLLSIRAVPGVGEKTAERLEGLGVAVLADVLSVPSEILRKRVGSMAERLRELARGVDPTPVVPEHDAKSISSETTLSEDTSDRAVLEQALLLQAETVGERARRAGLAGGTVTLKLRRADYARITRSVTLKAATASTRVIYGEGRDLLARAAASGPFRLIGVGLSNLRPVQESGVQLPLFGRRARVEGRTWNDAERAMDEIRSRFGREAITRARFVKPREE
jgi:DNA polymerase-4